MTKYKTIADLADAYVEANNLLDESIRNLVWNNFIRAWTDRYIDRYKPSQVVFVEFDRVFIDDGISDNDLIEIEI